jgi:hypothetical protein
MHCMVVCDDGGKLLHFYGEPYFPQGDPVCVNSPLHTNNLMEFMQRSNEIGTTIIEVWRPPRRVHIDLEKVSRKYCDKSFSFLPRKDESYDCISFVASLLTDLDLLKSEKDYFLQKELKKNGFIRLGRFNFSSGVGNK